MILKTFKPTESEQAEINTLRENTLYPSIIHRSGLDDLPDSSECGVGTICKVHDSWGDCSFELILTSAGWKYKEFEEKSCDWNEAEKAYSSNYGTWKPASDTQYVTSPSGTGSARTYPVYDSYSIDGGGIAYSPGYEVPDNTSKLIDPGPVALPVAPLGIRTDGGDIVYNPVTCETTTDNELSITGIKSSTNLEEVVENFTEKLQKIMDRLDEIERSQDEMKDEISKVYRALQAY